MALVSRFSSNRRHGQVGVVGVAVANPWSQKLNPRNICDHPSTKILLLAYLLLKCHGDDNLAMSNSHGDPRPPTGCHKCACSMECDPWYSDWRPFPETEECVKRAPLLCIHYYELMHSCCLACDIIIAPRPSCLSHAASCNIEKLGVTCGRKFMELVQGHNKTCNTLAIVCITQYFYLSYIQYQWTAFYAGTKS